MTDIEKAKQYLLLDNYTCVLCKDCEIHTSAQRGVKPLVIWLESGNDFNGFSAADKVVGKATAFLYVLLGIKEVYANVISKSALQVLVDNSINVEYGELVENIINRQGNGICPFESAVLEINDAQNAYKAIRNKMTEMNITV